MDYPSHSVAWRLSEHTRKEHPDKENSWKSEVLLTIEDLRDIYSDTIIDKVLPRGRRLDPVDAHKYHD